MSDTVYLVIKTLSEAQGAEIKNYGAGKRKSVTEDRKKQRLLGKRGPRQWFQKRQGLQQNLDCLYC